MASDTAISDPPRIDKTWWGSFEFNEGETRYWRIGPFELWLRRAGREWRIAYLQSEEPFSEELVVAGPAPGDDDLPEQASRLRYAFRETGARCRLQPALPDRALVVKPEVPFYVNPGEEVVLYVSSPLWLRIEVGEPPLELHAAPIYRPSDTWFGPPTIDGGLCYAGRTRARLRLDSVPRLAQRAISAINILNRAPHQLALERLRLPLPNLSLFCAQDQLWTEDVTLVREEDGDLAEIRFGSGPPDSAPGARRVAEPRQTAQPGLLTRAFFNLFDEA